MDRKSPLKDASLRQPGQSVEEYLREQLDSHVLLPGIAAIMLLLLAVLEWLRHFSIAPPSPWLFTLAALAAAGYAVFRFIQKLPLLKALQQGRNGERVVGQYLEQLRIGGYRVFHDLLGAGFNVDHVLVGEGGIFAIETKTFSKPPGRDPKIPFDGEVLTVAGFEPDRDPLIQAKAQAGWLRDLVRESTGRAFAVRPVILFPGWYVEQPKGTPREVWVLNPKALPAFLENEPARLSKEDVSLICFHLSRFNRARRGP